MKHIIAFLFCAAAFAATTVQVTGVTNTQAVLRVSGVAAASCTIEVSESATYTPLVHDVNATLFSGADQCGRASSTGQDGDWTIVVGLRNINTAANNRNYSRALQAATLHYYRVVNGGDMVTGTFTTATLPLGITHTDGFIPDDVYIGDPKYISVDQSGRETWIDPHTGVRAQMLQRSGDWPVEATHVDKAMARVSSAGWTNPDNFVTDTPAAYATFDGATCTGSCTSASNGMMIEDGGGGIGPNFLYDSSTDDYKLWLTGFGSSATAADRTVNICMVPNVKTYLLGGQPASPSDYYTPGTICDTHAGAVVKQIVLPQSTEGTVLVQDKFRKPGQTLHVHSFQHTDYFSNAYPRFIIWKANTTGTVSVRNARYGWIGSNKGNIGSAGTMERSNYNARSDGFYISSAMGTTNSFYAVHGETGEVRFLGVNAWYIVGFGFAYMRADHQNFSSTDPNVWFAQPQGYPDFVKFTYTGPMVDKAKGYVLQENVDFTVSSPVSDFYNKLLAFYAAHESEYYTMLGGAGNYNRFGVGPFTSCAIELVQYDHFTGYCRSNDADTPAWMFAFNSAGTVVALTPMYATASARWCTDHYQDILVDQPVISVFGQKSLYRTNLAAAIDDTTDTITVTSTCTGDCDGFHTGDPVAYHASMAAEFLMPIQVGDRLALTGYPYGAMGNDITEFVRVTQRVSNTEFKIQRGLLGVAAKAHLNGAAVHPYCSSWPGSTGTAWEMYYYYSPEGQDHSGQWTWDFINDPYGKSTDGSGVWNFDYQGHTVTRGNLFSNGLTANWSDPGTFVMKKDKLMGIKWGQWEPVGFGGKNGFGSGNAYQNHPSIATTRAPGLLGQSIWNAHPFIGGDPFTAEQDDDQVPGFDVNCDIDAAPIDVNPTTGCSAGRVAGYSHVYRYVAKTEPPTYFGIYPKHFAVFGVSGTKQLHDISGPNSVISDATTYAFCMVIAANECITGSSPGHIYFNSPELGVPWCFGNEGVGTAPYDDICIGSVEWKNAGQTQTVFGIKSKTAIHHVDDFPQMAGIANGSGSVRLLTRHASASAYRRIPGYTSTKPLNNGRYALVDWSHISEGTKPAVIKIPPVQVDSINRSEFYPVSVQLPAGSLPAGTSNVIAEFGYLEHGTAAQLYCNTRAETCVAHRSSVNNANPYSYATTESSTIGNGLSCASGCTLVIPAFPTRVLYYRVKYRDVSNNVILTGRTQVVAIP